jgi:hypothetical protein
VYDPQFEWAYSSPESTVFTCTMLLPTLSEAQQLMDNVDLTEQQLTEFYENGIMVQQSATLHAQSIWDD